MNNDRTADTPLAEALADLDVDLVDMGSLVESLFVGSVVALIDQVGEGMTELREEDYLAHERCIEIDKQAAAILAGDGLELEQVRLVLGTVKIASALKRAADEALHIAQGLRSCDGEALASARLPTALRGMTALVQTMLSEVVASVAEKRPSEMEPMHESMRELARLGERALDQLAAGGGAKGKRAVGVFLRAAQHLERIGHEAVDVATQVRHLYVPNHE